MYPRETLSGYAHPRALACRATPLRHCVTRWYALPYCGLPLPPLVDDSGQCTLPCETLDTRALALSRPSPRLSDVAQRGGPPCRATTHWCGLSSTHDEHASARDAAGGYAQAYALLRAALLEHHVMRGFTLLYYSPAAEDHG